MPRPRHIIWRINAIETGRYLPSLPLALALARHFGASVEQMFRPENGEVR